MSFQIQRHEYSGDRPGSRQLYRELPLGVAAEATEGGRWRGVVIVGRGQGCPTAYETPEDFASAEEAARSVEGHVFRRLRVLFEDQ